MSDDSISYLNRCQHDLQNAVSALGGPAQDPRLSSLAELIIDAMTGPWRSFHTPEHIFDVGAGGTPVEVIAALFHDLVYVQVDSGIHVNLARYLAPYIHETSKGLVIDPADPVVDQPLQLCLSVFGFEVGQLMSPFAGQNEFLSALVAAKALHGIVPQPALLQVVACIEATVPFRASNAEGKTCSQVLLERLRQLAPAFGLDEAACMDTVRMAVRVANRDIGNFASEQPTEFLNNTWNLIPETNHELVNIQTYTAEGYRISLQKMEGFLSFLQPGVVFRQFDTEPGDAEHQRRLALTERNLQVARLYLRSKLVSIALIEALSLRMGRGIALASMMGSAPTQGEQGIRLELYLPPVQNPYQPANADEAVVMDLLETGRSADSAHDVRHSPVASYTVKSIGMPGMLSLLEQARAFFAGKLDPEALLSSCPEVTQSLQRAACEVLRMRVQVLSGPAA